ncbi:4501_t:CDS:1, partial [Acaulospora colombiana]
VPEKVQTPPTGTSPEQGQSKKRQHSESSDSSPRPTKRVHQTTESPSELDPTSGIATDPRLKN